MENHEQEVRQDREDLIEGRNAVAEAIRAGRTIDKIFVARGDTDRTLARILAKARENGIVVTECDRRKLDSLSATGAHQGIIAQAAMREYASIEDILERARYFASCHRQGEIENPITAFQGWLQEEFPKGGDR